MSNARASGRTADGVAWSDLASPRPSLSVLRGAEQADVVVVGLGGTGLSALAELRRRSVDAIGIDAGSVAAGAAGRNGGFLIAGLASFHHDAVRQWGRARAAACYRGTLGALEEMYAETPAAIWRTGSLRVAASPAELEDCRAQLRAMEGDGLEAEWWEGPEGTGLRFPHDAGFQPVQRCNEVAASLMLAGTRLFGESRATTIGPQLVTTAGGCIRCGAVLVCVDGGLDRLLPELEGVVRSARLQMVGTEPLGTRVATCPVYSRYGYDYWQQLPTGELVLGGGRDAGGEAEWTAEEVTSRPVQAVLASLLDRVARPATAKVAWSWAGIVSYTASGLPVVRRLPSGVFAAGGYCGTGNLIGKLAGRALVELALDGRSELAELFDGPDGH